MKTSSPLTRRTFLTTAAVGAALPSALARAESASGASFREAARDLPLREATDVIVCGGGPAGIAAAIAAGRAGAKVRLLEVNGCLGGIWTAGLLCWILDWGNKPGLMAEILKRLEADGMRAKSPEGKPTNGYDPEAMKLLLEELCAEAGVTIHLHTRVCAANVDAAKRLTHVITESKSGREVYGAKVFVDCTGDGDLGALAGNGSDFGHPETGLGQPMSLMALLSGIEPDAIGEFYRTDDSKDWSGPKDRLRAVMEKAGNSPSYAKPTLFHLRDDLFALMANHEYGYNGTKAEDITRATLAARSELNKIARGLRSLGGPWGEVKLVATAEQIGVREGRRLRGRATVTADDLREGRTHDDAVCRVTFPIDIHSLDPKKEKGIEKAGFRAKPYDIPLRALIAQDVDALLMAGRCISGDFIAHASYRVTGNSVPMGEAAGTTAALAAQRGKLPHEIPWRDARELLRAKKV